ncbi:lipase/acyltransferase domain-containing protein [Priestia megaterium]|uniref:lipase/acyltransferase domain-containing protein n=1 Tax=Priestia megaterium TaxID=1404 RepID=UPI000BFD20E7|nr:hypothetical protein [Priestia megaterium]PGQ79684.1 hypothetical protein COA18_27930 [Priestia megaterium]
MTYCVFIHGIQGSELWEGLNKRWPVVKREAIGRTALSRDQKENKVWNPDVLKYAYGYPVYNKIDNFLSEKFGKENFLHFTYDWRLDIRNHFETLYSKIKGRKEVVIVAHSMGGLLTKLFIHWCYETEKKDIDIKKVITIGTPWKGAPESIYWLLFGDQFPRLLTYLPPIIGLNTAKDLRDVCNTFPAVYQLLPHERYIDTDNPVLCTFNYKVIKSFQTYSDSHSVFSSEQLEFYREYSKPIQGQLQEEWPEGIDHLAIIGHTYSTLGEIVLDQISNYLTIKKKTIEWVSGDGTVPIKSGKPDFKCSKVYIRKKHVDLVKSQDVLDLVYATISEDKTYQQPEVFSKEWSGKFHGIRLRVACPVEVSVMDTRGNLLAGEVDEAHYLDYLPEIEKSEDVNVFKIGDSYHFFIDDESNLLKTEENDLKLEISSYDTGVATVEIDRYENGVKKKNKLFKGLEINSDSKAFLNLHNPKHIEDSELILQSTEGSTEVEGFTVDKENNTNKDFPRTIWKINNNPIGNTESTSIYNSSTISISIDEVQGVSEEAILEFRYIINGDMKTTENKSFNISARTGKNKLVVYTVTKDGISDVSPRVINFIVGDAVIVNKEIILRPETIDVKFNVYNVDGKELQPGDEKKWAFAKLSNEDKFEPTPAIYLKEYPRIPITVEYYTSDKNENKADSFTLPTQESRDEIFGEDNKIKDIFLALGLKNPKDWEVKINAKKVKKDPLKRSINANTRNIELLNKDFKYMIIIKDDFEVYIEGGSPEVINLKKDEELFNFVIKKVSDEKNVNIHELENVYIKLFNSKDNEVTTIPIEFSSNKFFATLNTQSIGQNIQRGVMKFFVNDRCARDLNFIVI